MDPISLIFVFLKGNIITTNTELFLAYDLDPKSIQIQTRIWCGLWVWVALSRWGGRSIKSNYWDFQGFLGKIIHFAMQRTPVQSLVWEDPTCLRDNKPLCHDTEPVHYSPLVETTEPMCHNYLSPRLEPVLYNKRSHCIEKFMHRNGE